MRKIAVALCVVLVSPLALADDNETETLHNNVYQEASGSLTCSVGAEICTLTFPATTHITTQIKSVSCTLAASTDFQAYLVELSGQSELYGFVQLQPFYVGNAAGGQYLVFQSNLDLFLGKGDMPTITMYYSQGYSQLRCSISGFHS